MSDESLQKAREHLDALVAFIESPAYTGYLSAVNHEIDLVKERMLVLPPVTDQDRAQLLMLHGEKDTLESDLKRFEDARVSLERRIDEIAEAELENATETKK